MVRETKKDRRYRKQRQKETVGTMSERGWGGRRMGERQEIGEEGRERERETRNMINSYRRRNRYTGKK